MKCELRKFGTQFARLTIQCPFYKFERDRNLYCEGGKIKFMSNEHRKEFISEHCGRLENWRQCTLAMHLNREYEKIKN